MKIINLIKIWSDSVNETNLKKLLIDLEAHEESTWEKFLIISSWAVKFWKKIIEKKWWKIKNFELWTLAWIWQNHLIQMYDKLSSKTVWEILLNDHTNQDYINTFIKNTFIKYFSNKALRPC